MIIPPKLSDRILVVALALSIVQVAVSATSYFFNHWSMQADHQSSAFVTAQGQVERINRLVVTTVMEARGIYAQTTFAGAAPFEAGMKRALDDLDAVVASTNGAISSLAPTEFQQALAKAGEFVAFRRQFLKMCHDESLAACRAFSDNDTNRSNRKALNAALDALAAKLNAQGKAAGEKVQSWQARVGQLGYVSLATPIVIMIVATFLLTVGVRRPFQAIAESIRQLAQGNLKAVIFGGERRDEFGEIARSLAIFRDELLRGEESREERDNMRAQAEAQQARMQEEAEANRAAANETRVRAERERVAATEAAVRQERELVSNSLGAAITRLSQKDLQCRLTTSLPKAYSQLQNDFNAAIEAIERAIGDVVGSARAVAAGSTEIARASDDLSRRTGVQASNLEELTAALVEVSEKVAETADGAKAARDAVTLASATARDGEDIARKTSLAMKKIETSSNQISVILSLINEISYQTNLLALNASVEAARAGEAGLGFSVVAAEVRALAQRSAAAAKEIETLIAQAASEVAEGGRLVASSGEAFVAIQAAIDNGRSMVAQIAERAEDQASGLKEINGAIRQLEAMTHQNASMAEEATAASQSLSRESDKLADLTSGFRIGATAPAQGRGGKYATRAA